MADPVLITVAQADDHLRLNLTVEQASPLTFADARLDGLLLKMVAAEAIVLDYLKIGDVDPLGSPPSFTERDLDVIRSAVLLILSALWDDAPERTVADYMRPQTGTVPLLLARLRDPCLQ